MFRKILVATDLSEASMPALRTALALARSTGAEVIALTVTETPYAEHKWYAPYLETDQEYLESIGLRFMDAAYRAVEQQVERAAPAPGTAVQTMVRPGIPADVIPAAAVGNGADLIVMGTHGRTGVEHALLGSIAEKVMRKAICPVLTVRPGAES